MKDIKHPKAEDPMKLINTTKNETAPGPRYGEGKGTPFFTMKVDRNMIVHDPRPGHTQKSNMPDNDHHS